MFIVNVVCFFLKFGILILIAFEDVVRNILLSIVIMQRFRFCTDCALQNGASLQKVSGGLFYFKLHIC